LGVVNSYQELKRMDHESIYRSSPNEAFSCRLCDLFRGLFQKEDDAWDKRVSRFIGGSKLCFRARVDDREIKTNEDRRPDLMRF
jgi:hypothetical protein